jgi:4-amino-4-deoxychorismate lyase
MAALFPSVYPESFQIISSLRFEPALPGAVVQYGVDHYPELRNSPYYLLPYHKDRLLNAAVHFHWENATAFLQKDLAQLVEILDASIPDRTKPWRLRIVIDRNGPCTVDAHPTAPLPLHSLFIPDGSNNHQSINQSRPWHVYLDSQPTIPSAFTTHKTTAREAYTAARARAGISSFQDPAEVLVVNPEGEIMEGSITTPYFRRRRRCDLADAIGNEEGTSSTDWITPPLSSGGNAGTTRRFALSQGFCVEEVIKAADLVDEEECWLSNGVRGFIQAIITLRR